MASENGGKKGLIFTSIFLALSVIATAVMALRFAGEGQPTRHTIVYFAVSAFSMVASAFMLFIDYNYNNKGSETARAYFFWDESPVRILGINKGVGAFIWIAVAVLVIASSGVLGKSVIPIQNPYDFGSPLNQASLNQHSTFQNVVNVGFFPMFEEVPILLFVSSIMLLFMLALSKPLGRITAFIIGLLPSVIAGAFLFTFAHGVSYGADQAAYVAAFVYSVVVMLANLLTGMFMSPLIHFLHNTSIVVFGYAIALSLSGVAPNALFILKKKIRGEPS